MPETLLAPCSFSTDLDVAIAPKRTPAAGRYASLDLWRGVACLAVIVYHATMQAVPVVTPGDTFTSRLGYLLVQATGLLWVGVPMFFVISGYCISATLEKSIARGDSLGDYFYRRFRRIYPPFWAALALSLAVVCVVEWWLSPGLLSENMFSVLRPESLGAAQWLGNITLTETWRSHVAGGNQAMLLPHVWTLCYEEQFYAVAGLILLVAPRRRYLAAAIVSLVVAVTMVAAKKLGFSVEGTFLDGRWLLFAAGVLVYYALHRATPAGRNAITLLLVVAAAAYLAAGRVPLAMYLDRDLERFTAIAFALLLIGLYRWDSVIANAKLLRPIVACGTMCYSLYLAHALVTKAIGHGLARSGYDDAWTTLLVAVPLGIAGSIAVGWMFFHTVEKRFLNSRVA